MPQFDIHEPMFPPRVVCAATDIPAPTIQHWIRAGEVGDYDFIRFEPSGMGGTGRKFSIADVHGLGLRRRFADIGLTGVKTLMQRSHKIATDYLANYPHVKELNLRWYTSGQLLFGYDDHLMDTPIPEGWVGYLKIDLVQIFDEISEALRIAAMPREGMQVVIAPVTLPPRTPARDERE